MEPRNTLYFRTHFNKLYPRLTFFYRLSRWLRIGATLLGIVCFATISLFIAYELNGLVFFIVILEIGWVLVRLTRPNYWGWGKWPDTYNWLFIFIWLSIAKTPSPPWRFFALLPVLMFIVEGIYYAPQNYPWKNIISIIKNRNAPDSTLRLSTLATNLKGFRIIFGGIIILSSCILLVADTGFCQEQPDSFCFSSAWLIITCILLIIDILHHGSFYKHKLLTRWTRDRLLVLLGSRMLYATILNRWIYARKRARNQVLQKTLNKFFIWTTIAGLLALITSILLNVIISSVVIQQKPISQIEYAPSELSIVSISFLAITCGIVASILNLIRNKLPSQVMVLPFEPIGNSDPELISLANLITHSLVSELQRIGQLLSSRQIENGYSNLSNDAYPITLTTGNPSEFSREIEQFVSIQAAGGQVQVSISSFLTRIARFFAGMMVQGTIQRRENGTIGIWTGLSRRNAATISAKTVITPRNSSSDIDEVTINKITRDLALRLFVELGGEHRASSTVESLEAFLQGIEASRKHQWYRAISYYQKAINSEEISGTRYGLGHYHLGAALTFAGEFEQGLRHFQIAEESGLPSSDLHYMLARATLNLYWDGLHTDTTAFDSIKRHCQLGLAEKPNSPEIYHLLGSAYYRRGRLQERDRSCQFDNEQADKYRQHKRFLDWLGNYQYAVRYLRRAIIGYDKEINGSLILTSTSKSSLRNSTEKILEARMAATHQLADGLRGSRRFEEAEHYYEEFLIAYPRNLRTLVDLSKTFCLAGQWQKALKFIEQRILTEEKAMWNADVNFYLGWATIACIKDEVTFSTIRYLPLIKDLLGYETPIDPKERARLFAHAINHLGFAIHQRPRYLARWTQNDWSVELESAFKRLLNYHRKNNDLQPLNEEKYNKIILTQIGKIFREEDKPRSEEITTAIVQSILWLMLRIENYPLTSKLKYCSLAQQLLPNLSTIRVIDLLTRTDASKVEQNSIHWNVQKRFDELVELRQEAAKLLKFIANSERQKGLEHSWRRLEFAQKAYSYWRTSYEHFEEAEVWILAEPLKTPTDDTSDGILSTLPHKLMVDIIAGKALLCSRFYSEAGAYERAKDVVEKTEIILSKWRKYWQKTFGREDREDYRMDYLVFRYQLASIQSWHAYLIHQCHTDVGVRLRVEQNTKLDSRQFELISTKLSEAFSTMGLHRLALYGQAKLYSEADWYGEQNVPIQAKSLLSEVLQLIAPFDPFRLVDSWGPRYDVQPRTKKPEILSLLDRVGQVHGQNQFDTLLNEAHIHTEIAEAHYDLGEINSSIEHLHAAIVVSSHADIEAEIFLTLVRRLTLRERFDEAHAILEAMRLPTFELTNKSLSIHKRGEPNVVECIVLTRQRKYAEAYVLGRQVARNLHLNKIRDRPHKYNIQVFSSDYKLIVAGLEEMIYSAEDNQATQNRADSVNPNLMSWLHKFEAFWLRTTNKFDNPTDKTEDRSNSTKPLFLPNPFSENTIKNVKVKPTLELNLIRLLPRLFDKSDKVIQEALFISLIRFSLFHKFDGHSKFFKGLKADLKINVYQDIHDLLHKNYPENQNTEDEKLYQSLVIRTHILLMLLDESVRLLNQIAELSNTLAFNKAAVNSMDILAFEDARYAVLLFRFLKLGAKKDIGKELRALINDNLANSLDTLGWVYYQIATTHSSYQRQEFVARMLKSDLMFLNFDRALIENESLIDEAIVHDSLPLLYVARYQTEQGLIFAPDKAIIHYHLTRIHMTTLERLWQGISDKSDEENISTISPYVSMHLRKADRNWALAHKYDVTKRLHENLVWLRHRIDDYNTTWHQRQVNSFRGTNTIDSI